MLTKKAYHLGSVVTNTYEIMCMRGGERGCSWVLRLTPYNSQTHVKIKKPYLNPLTEKRYGFYITLYLYELSKLQDLCFFRASSSARHCTLLHQLLNGLSVRELDDINALARL